MIASGVVVYVSCQPVDFRKGAASLMALVRDGGLDPFSGALHACSARSVRTGFASCGGTAAGFVFIRRLWKITASAGLRYRPRACVSTTPS